MKRGPNLELEKIITKRYSNNSNDTYIPASMLTSRSMFQRLSSLSQNKYAEITLKWLAFNSFESVTTMAERWRDHKPKYGDCLTIGKIFSFLLPNKCEHGINIDIYECLECKKRL